MAEELTKVQRETLDFIKQYVARNGYAPSVAEMSVHAGITGTATVGRLRLLERKGYIKRLNRKARAIHVVENP